MLPSPRVLKDAAKQSLNSASYDPRKLIFIHTGVMFLLSGLLMVVDYLLEQQIGATSGLQGMGPRAILSTIQTVLQLVQTVFLPFWQVGYIFAVLKIARREAADPRSLLQGFRRFWPIFRLQALMGLFFFILIFICSYIAAFAFMMTPMGNSLTLQMMEMLESGALETNPELLEQAVYALMMENILPILLIFGVIFLAAVLPFYFRFRFAQYVIMDGGNRIFVALGISWKATKGNCRQLLKLDLSFWWFYALDVLLAAVCYADVLLQELGVPLSWTPDTSYFLFMGIYLVGQLALYCLCHNRVAVTYAQAYRNLTTKQL